MVNLDNKKLLINVDDFGLHQSVNEAVVELFERGVVNSTSAIANRLTETDAEQLRTMIEKGLKVNVHLNLVDGEILAKPLKEYFASDLFPSVDWWLASGKFPPQELIYAEFEAQLEVFKNFKIQTTSVDYHCFYPTFDHQIWPTYKLFAQANSFKYRGNKLTLLQSSLLKTLTPGTFTFALKALRRNPLEVIRHIVSSQKRNDEGSYRSDYSISNNSANIPHIVNFFHQLTSDETFELISHAANERALKSSLPFKEKRVLEYTMLLKT